MKRVFLFILLLLQLNVLKGQNLCATISYVFQLDSNIFSERDILMTDEVYGYFNTGNIEKIVETIKKEDIKIFYFTNLKNCNATAVKSKQTKKLLKKLKRYKAQFINYKMPEIINTLESTSLEPSKQTDYRSFVVKYMQYWIPFMGMSAEEIGKVYDEL